jgi:nucleotide-binding universal stress UspA family protein
MLQKILVPLDGSSAAEIVLPFAEEIATKSAAGITLVTATGTEPQDLEPLYRSYLDRTRDKVQDQLSGYPAGSAVKLDTRVLKGSPADEILHYAEEAKTDLIVMASRGSTSHGPWLLGSIARRVTVASTEPVLVVKNPATQTAVEQKKIFKRIMVPLDGSPAGEAALPFTEELASKLGSELILFHDIQPVASWVGYGMGASYAAIEEPENVRRVALAYLESVRVRLAKKGLPVKVVLQDGAPAELIIEYAKAEAVDVIAISTHGRSGISRWVFGSVTEKVLQYGKPAVLVVRTSKV